MKIAAIETQVVSIPLTKAVTTPVHHITTVDNVLVRLFTDEGISGTSYLWTFGPKRAQVLQAMVEDLGEALLGEDALERELIWHEMWTSANFLSHAGVSLFGLSAIDIALWDIAGKAMDLPLYRVLGGSRRPVPIYAGGLFLSDSLEEIVRETESYIAKGFHAIKMRVGAKQGRDDVARVKAVREAIGPDRILMLDVVQGWNVETAVRMGRELERFDIYWLEDPVAFDDIDGMAKVTRALNVPITAGECDYSKHGFRHLIEEGAADILMIDLQRVGGVTEWMKVAAMAEA